MDFGSRLSYGGGGGGGGGSAFSVPGGRGGNGGGLVYLQVDELTLDGEILAKGNIMCRALAYGSLICLVSSVTVRSWGKRLTNQSDCIKLKQHH